MDEGSSIVFFAPLDDYSNMLLVTASAPDQLAIELLNLRTGNHTVLQTVEAPGWEAVSFVAANNQLDIKLDDSVLSVPIYDPNVRSASSAKIFTTVNPDRRRAAAFEQAWADLKYRYYQRELEGRDWDAIGAKYRAYLGSIATSRELTELVAAMYGELSASHLFADYAGLEGTRLGLGTRNDTLGVYLDYGYEGPGRRVAAVLPGGPLDRAGLGVDAGDIISSINGIPVPEAGGMERLLDVNLGKRTLIGVRDQGQDEERFIYVDPISYGSQLRLARERLLDARAGLVDRLSNSCVVYQYVADMDEASYINVMGKLSSSRDLAKAALIDVRSNGGGNLTRELITLLSGTAYAQVGRTGGPIKTEPNNRWVWPSAVLVDSFSYSDAAIFPQAYQDAGIGLLVGDTVLNTGTYVSRSPSKLVPGFTYAIPILPIRHLDGSYYENHVIEPDIAVPFDPNTVGINTDPQLEAAVAALMKQIGADTDCRLP
jgi:tricorn protease